MPHHASGSGGLSREVILALPFALALILYGGGVVFHRRRGSTWPWYRSLFWVLGVGAAAAGFVGPLAVAAHGDFVAHMGAHLLVGMAHFLLAGYVFTVAIIPIDPAPHRAGFPLRIAVLVLALAAHGILAKTIYASPPAGVATPEAQAGAMLMYYAGDVIDAVIIAVLCAQWYRHGSFGIRRAAAAVPRHTARG